MRYIEYAAKYKLIKATILYIFNNKSVVHKSNVRKECGNAYAFR